MGMTKSDFDGRSHRWARQSLKEVIEAAKKDPADFARRILQHDLRLAKLWDEVRLQLEENCISVEALEDDDRDGKMSPLRLFDLTLKGYQHEDMTTLLKHEPKALDPKKDGS